MITALIGVAVAAFGISGGVAVALIIGAALIDAFLLPSLFGADVPKSSTSASNNQKVNFKGADEYIKFVYGTAVVGGLYAYVNTYLEDQVLGTVIAHTYHEINRLLDVRYDDASVYSERDFKALVTDKTFSASISNPREGGRVTLTFTGLNTSGDPFFPMDIAEVESPYGNSIEIIGSDSPLCGIYAVLPIPGTEYYSSSIYTVTLECVVLKYHNTTSVPQLGIGGLALTGSTSNVNLNLLYGSSQYRFGSPVQESMYEFMPEKFREEWGYAHTLSNMAYTFNSYKYNREVWSGIPTAQIEVEGLKVKDLRTVPESTGIDSISFYDDDFGTLGKIVVADTTIPSTLVDKIKANRKITLNNITTVGDYTVSGDYILEDINLFEGNWRIYFRLLYNTPIGQYIYEPDFDISAPDILSSEFVFSSNWALCIYDFLTNRLYGLGTPDTEIDEASFIAAANYSDDYIACTGNIGRAGNKVWDDYLGNLGLVVESSPYYEGKNIYSFYLYGDYTEDLRPGRFVTLDSSYEFVQEIPFGSSAILGEIIDVAYSAPVVDDEVVTTLPDPPENPEDPEGFATYDIVVSEKRDRKSEILSMGRIPSGTSGYYHTYFRVAFPDTYTPPANSSFIKAYSKRYEVNGVFDTGQTPIDTLESMVQCGAGSLAFTQGKYFLYPAKYDSPQYTIDESYLAGNLSVLSGKSRNAIFNSVKGIFIDRLKNSETTDFAEYIDTEYLADDDGLYIPKDFDFGYITDPAVAQRIARIYLEQTRYGMLITMECNFKALHIPLFSNVNLSLTLDRYKPLSNKVFKVVSWSLENSSDSEIVKLILREEDPSIYTSHIYNYLPRQLPYKELVQYTSEAPGYFGLPYANRNVIIVAFGEQNNNLDGQITGCTVNGTPITEIYNDYYDFVDPAIGVSRREIIAVYSFVDDETTDRSVSFSTTYTTDPVAIGNYTYRLAGFENNAAPFSITTQKTPDPAVSYTHAHTFDTAKGQGVLLLSPDNWKSIRNYVDVYPEHEYEVGGDFGPSFNDPPHTAISYVITDDSDPIKTVLDTEVPAGNIEISPSPLFSVVLTWR